jgi:hypothetical protein
MGFGEIGLKASAAILGLTPWAVLAQIEPISGGAGWIGAGLLGAVLSWLLLVHLPTLYKFIEAQGKETRALIDSKDLQIKALVDSRELYSKLMSDLFLAEVHRMQDGNEKNLSIVVGHCKDELKGIETYLHARIHDMLGGLQTIMNRLEIVCRLLSPEKQWDGTDRRKGKDPP